MAQRSGPWVYSVSLVPFQSRGGGGGEGGVVGKEKKKTLALHFIVDYRITFIWYCENISVSHSKLHIIQSVAYKNPYHILGKKLKISEWENCVIPGILPFMLSIDAGATGS